jgi:hypothetical protein
MVNNILTIYLIGCGAAFLVYLIGTIFDDRKYWNITIGKLLGEILPSLVASLFSWVFFILYFAYIIAEHIKPLIKKLQKLKCLDIVIFKQKKSDE